MSDQPNGLSPAQRLILCEVLQDVIRDLMNEQWKRGGVESLDPLHVEGERSVARIVDILREQVGNPPDGATA